MAGGKYGRRGQGTGDRGQRLTILIFNLAGLNYGHLTHVLVYRTRYIMHCDVDFSCSSRHKYH